jgi:aromatic ring-opening dioxygenase catalytic subunit (LigB family)
MTPSGPQLFMLKENSSGNGSCQRRLATVMTGNHAEVVNFHSLGRVAAPAHPTHDHFLPLLYCLGIAAPGAEVQTFNDGFQWPGVSMRSFVLA